LCLQAVALIFCCPILIGPLWLPAEVAATPMDVGGTIDLAPLAEPVEVLKDPSRRLDFDAVLQLPPGAWQGYHDKMLRFGHSDAAWWVRLKLRNGGTAPRHLILEVGGSRLDEVDVYQLRGAQVVASYQTGDQRPFGDRPLHSRAVAVPLTLEAGESSLVLIRLDSADGVYDVAVLGLRDPGTFEKKQKQENWLWGAYYGALTALLAYNLLLFAATRDRNFLYYCLYLGAFGFWSFGFLGGFGFAWLWPDQPSWNNYFDVLIPAWTHILATLFVVHYLQTRQRSPRLHRLLIALTLLVQIPSLLLVAQTKGAPDWHAQTHLLTDIFLVLHSTLILLYLVAGIHVLRQGFRPAIYFVLAWSFLIVGGLIQHLVRLPGLLPVNWLTTHSVVVGSTLEFLLMAFALAARLKQLETDKRMAQASEQALQRDYAQTLQRQVAERTGALNQALDRLRTALDAERVAKEEQRTFLDTIAHELRTPLTVIDTIAQNLMLDAGDADPATRDRYAKILQASHRLSGLLDHQLADDRRSLVRNPMQRVPCDPAALLQDAATAAALWSDRHRIRVCADGLPDVVFCDPDLTRLALRNLADNAAKYTPPGTHVLLHGGRGSDGVWLEVADQGPALPAGEVEQLLNPQFRGSNADGKPGKGLGLALARRMIEDQGGSLTLTKHPCAGLSFRIWLPGPDADDTAGAP
jgi:two-component system, sensor histidine kinase LadS